MSFFWHEKGKALLEEGDVMPDFETKWWTKERLAELEKEGYFKKAKAGQRAVAKNFTIMVGGELVTTPSEEVENNGEEED